MSKISFYLQKEFGGLGQPKPSKENVPEWYHQAELSYGAPVVQPGLKKCIPFLDALLTGYQLTLPVDLHVFKGEDGGTGLSWDADAVYAQMVVQRDPRQGETLPRPAGHLPDHFAFSNKWAWKVPEGYSVLVTHPLNRFDLPFTVTSGVIDSDNYWGSGFLPFFLREDFEGIVPAGTPIAQLIPFKREDWTHVENDPSMDSEIAEQVSGLRTPEGSYKRKFWQQKRFR
jgi:hypothetical protein